jgi:iron complex outermembrane receptor protein
MRTSLSYLAWLLRRTGRTASFLAFAVLTPGLLLPSTALAQEATEVADEETAGEAMAVDRDVEVVVVTGSRLKRDTYTSVSPLQIITAEVAREAGLVDATKILQESTAAAGVQIDITFSGFVLDEGPGAATANLRGLGSNRTLVLVNGRRIAPAGVEGAPTAPDLGIIPGTLVQQYDQLLDGASSIYGSDAVAGVVNVILQKDFDGFEFEVLPSFPAHGAGQTEVLGMRWGRNFDRGFIGIGAEYYDQDPITLDDRPWTAGCDKHVEIDQGGRIRRQELWYAENYGMEWDECRLGSLAARVFVPGMSTGSIYWTPGYSNGGWPDFSESSTYGFGVDGDGDGKTDLTFRDYDINGREQFAHLYGIYKTTSVMTYGEYTFEGEMNLTPYFEALYSTRESYSNAGVFQLFPDVPASNPYNICNPNGAGVDCGLAEDALLLAYEEGGGAAELAGLALVLVVVHLAELTFEAEGLEGAVEALALDADSLGVVGREGGVAVTALAHEGQQHDNDGDDGQHGSNNEGPHAIRLLGGLLPV